MDKKLYTSWGTPKGLLPHERASEPTELEDGELEKEMRKMDAETKKRISYLGDTYYDESEDERRNK